MAETKQTRHPGGKPPYPRRPHPRRPHPRRQALSHTNVSFLLCRAALQSRWDGRGPLIPQTTSLPPRALRGEQLRHHPAEGFYTLDAHGLVPRCLVAVQWVACGDASVQRGGAMQYHRPVTKYHLRTTKEHSLPTCAFVHKM